MTILQFGRKLYKELKASKSLDGWEYDDSDMGYTNTINYEFEYTEMFNEDIERVVKLSNKYCAQLRIIGYPSSRYDHCVVRAIITVGKFRIDKEK